MFFFIKGTGLLVWETKDINIGGTGLTNITCTSIGNTKFINTMKYNQTSLDELATALTDDEKIKVETLTKQFLMQRRYFQRLG